MHGNAAEWTRTPYGEGRENKPHDVERKVVRGRSFFDPPPYGRSASRVAYPSWQRVFNVGFRVVCESTDVLQVVADPDEKR